MLDLTEIGVLLYCAIYSDIPLMLIMIRMDQVIFSFTL